MAGVIRQAFVASQAKLPRAGVMGCTAAEVYQGNACQQLPKPPLASEVDQCCVDRPHTRFKGTNQGCRLHVGGFACPKAEAGTYDVFALCLVLPGIWSFASDPSAPFTQKPRRKQTKPRFAVLCHFCEVLAVLELRRGPCLVPCFVFWQGTKAFSRRASPSSTVIRRKAQD